MAIRTIVKDGDDILRKVSKPVEMLDDKTFQLLDDLLETVNKVNGVGLAAVQVGVLRRVAVIIDFENDEVIELINPEIISQSGEQYDVEGCLSFPGKYGMVTRGNVVKVKSLTRLGGIKTYTGEGLTARAFCHEIDHMNGIVFGDRVEELVDA